jgi:scavenger receptor class B, member 1
MHPNKENHEFSVALEPRTGIPLNVRAQLQINLLMKPYPWTPTFKNVPEIMMPMFYFRQVAAITEELSGQAKIAVLLPNFGVWAAYGFVGIGVLLLALLTYCSIYRWRTVNDDEELLN